MQRIAPCRQFGIPLKQASDPVNLARSQSGIAPSQAIIKLGDKGAVVAFIDGRLHHQAAVPSIRWILGAPGTLLLPASWPS